MPGHKPTPRRPSLSPHSSFRGKNVVMASRGRAPWYTPDGKAVPAYVIGIAGGSSSGKTSVARAICKGLNNIPTVLILSQDAFYKRHTQEEIDRAMNNDFDFDHPDSIDMELFAQCLNDLKLGRATEIPVYSFEHHQRLEEKQYLYGASVIIVEGIMALQAAEMRDLYDLKVFVNCDSDLMLARRIRRDTVERGRDVDGILDQYLRFVKSSYDNFVQPSSKYADIIVPGHHNDTAIELLVTHLQRQLDARSLRFRRELVELDSTAPTPSEVVNVQLVPQTNQLLGIMTILRSADTKRNEFIFYADRLSTIIVEAALAELPRQSKDITTANGVTFHGVDGCDSNIIGVSILRSGGPFANGLRRVIRDVPLGSMLIQSEPQSGEPLLLDVKLPESLHSRNTARTMQVLLLDSQMGTGAAALMAIRVLLDHGVPQSNITFLTFLVSRYAVHSVHRAFPSVRIVTAAIDDELDEVRLPVVAGHTLGEVSAEGDFSARVVAMHEDAIDFEGGVETPTGDALGNGVGVGLRFSRGEKKEKIAWVVKPGMGHVGDRYYLS
ncbi:uridine kinase [Cutaneotrichosporon oleaginosum]|uniref:Uridine kinase n=1 Tax=Cutaneotrichosporon oleaginosum TaxID=879819 RepID=A0A0J0XIQ8_9TREE|nr:uridine kinase [Cutaneotrichosporon oleaginosum]KLT40937.1 uridine kinase [Cutaneotrichosporon oleaginosum]TXT15430.1 hypothetical protein COLE_01623 [Cutaneotrichosporon oleaginosum]